MEALLFDCWTISYQVPHYGRNVQSIRINHDFSRLSQQLLFSLKLYRDSSRKSVERLINPGIRLSEQAQAASAKGQLYISMGAYGGCLWLVLLTAVLKPGIDTPVLIGSPS
jgi:hypothetical protein